MVYWSCFCEARATRSPLSQAGWRLLYTRNTCLPGSRSWRNLLVLLQELILETWPVSHQSEISDSFISSWMLKLGQCHCSLVILCNLSGTLDHCPPVIFCTSRSAHQTQSWNFQWSSWETTDTPVWPMLRTDTTLMWNNPPHLDSGPNTSFSFAISHQMSVLCHFKLCKSDWPSPKLTEKVFGTNCEHTWMRARWRLGDD